MSSEQEIKSRLSHPAWVLVLAGIPLVVCLYAGPLFYDDAYITFRYAENISAGKGFVFNQDPVMGTTAPFYCLLLALAGAVRLPIPGSAFVIGVIAGALAPVLVWRLGIVVNQKAAGLLGGLFLCLFPRWWLNANTGMETTLAGCLTLLVLILYFREKGLPGGVLGGVLILTRPDTAFLPLLVFIHLLVKNRKQGFAFAGGGAMVILPWMVYSFLTFGSPLPQSLAAKGLIHAYPWLLAWQDYLDWFFAVYQPLGMVLFSALWVLGAATIMRSLQAFILVAWPVVFIAGLSFTQVGPFPWYHIPVLPVFMFVVAYGVFAVYEGRGLASRLPPAYRRATCGILAGAMVFCGLFEAAPLLSSREDLSRLRDKEQKLKKMSETIDRLVQKEGLDPSEVEVFVGEVGVIGYELRDYRIIDSSGINSPNVYEIRRRDWERMKKEHPDYGWKEKWHGSEQWVREIIRKYQPEFITSNLDYLHLRTLRDDPRFREKYRLVDSRLFYEEDREKEMAIFAKRGQDNSSSGP